MAKMLFMERKELKRWRERHNLTQMELGDLLGVSYVTVARWELGTRKIPSFLYLALEALEKRKGNLKTRAKKGGGEKQWHVSE